MYFLSRTTARQNTIPVCDLNYDKFKRNWITNLMIKSEKKGCVPQNTYDLKRLSIIIITGHCNEKKSLSLTNGWRSLKRATISSGVYNAAVFHVLNTNLMPRTTFLYPTFTREVRSCFSQLWGLLGKTSFVTLDRIIITSVKYTVCIAYVYGIYCLRVHSNIWFYLHLRHTTLPEIS